MSPYEEKTQVNLQVSENQKAWWESHAESFNDMDSLSMLIRYSVEKEIRQRIKDESELNEVHESLSDQIDDVNRSIRELTDTMEELSESTVEDRDLEEFADGMLRAVIQDTLDEASHD